MINIIKSFYIQSKLAQATVNINWSIDYQRNDFIYVSHVGDCGIFYFKKYLYTWSKYKEKPIGKEL